MRDPPIWETAGRPLYVRSVWLAVSGRRGLQRHFILDYDEWPVEKRQHQELMMKSSSLRWRNKKNNYSPSETFDFDDTIDDSSEELYMLGSGKVKFQLPQIPHQREQQQRRMKHYKDGNAQRDPSLPSPSKGTSESRSYETFPELHSRRSSLQDLQSTLSNAASSSNPDERLAERVLNWLDLAGKTSSLPQADNASNFGEAANTEDVTQKTWQGCQQPTAPSLPLLTELKQQQQQQQLNTARKRSCMVPRSSRRLQCDPAKQQQQQQNHQHQNRNQHQRYYQHQRPESMKHISIIFNKEGAVPVRLNRSAAPRIDLATLVASADRPVREPVATSRCENRKNRPATLSAGAIIAATLAEAKAAERKKHNCLGDILSTHPQYFFEDTVNSWHDSKKQLHIFIPNLVKRSLLSSSGGEDVASLLSNPLSENFSSLLN